MTWRKLGGEILAGMDSLDDQNPDRFVLYPVHLLSNLLLERVLEQRNASVYMSHPVVAVGQHNHTAWVDVKLENEIKRIEADFVVGCDGASSAVRKALFGDNFPGSTWEKQIVVTNVASSAPSSVKPPLTRPLGSLRRPQIWLV